MIGLWSGDAVAERPPKFVTRAGPIKPPWASRIWEDEFGELAAFEINGVEFRLRRIRAGSFTMGSPEDEKDRQSREGPSHRVTITRDFWIGITPMTQRQWMTLAEENPSQFKGDLRPVETVSWHDVQAWLDRLTEHLPKLPARLPTEAEWEYACRAGTSTRFYSGDDAASLADVAWYTANNRDGKTHDVGEKEPNAWGLRDMHGNVDEWCLDGIRKYEDSEIADPLGPTDQGVDSRYPRRQLAPFGPGSAARRTGSRSTLGSRNLSLGFRLVAGHSLLGPEGRSNQSSGGAG